VNNGYEYLKCQVRKRKRFEASLRREEILMSQSCFGYCRKWEAKQMRYHETGLFKCASV